MLAISSVTHDERPRRVAELCRRCRGERITANPFTNVRPPTISRMSLQSISIASSGPSSAGVRGHRPGLASRKADGHLLAKPRPLVVGIVNVHRRHVMPANDLIAIRLPAHYVRDGDRTRPSILPKKNGRIGVLLREGSASS